MTEHDMTDTVRLREVIVNDLPIFFEQQNDPIATEMAAFPARDRDAFMAHWAKIRMDKSVQARTILFNEEVAGNLVSFDMESKRELGYWLGRIFWGKGIATLAVSQFLQYESTRPLYGYVAKQNPGSRRVLEKCGFSFLHEDKEYNVLELK